jgi:flagellar biosynthesis/type III secretory pathway protein FliH
MARAAVDAHLQADALVHRAKERAHDVLLKAQAEAATVTAGAAREAERAEHAKLAAAWLALHQREEARAERDIDRAIALAVALAERLVGAALEIDPSKIALLARQALSHVRGARRAVIEAHALDVETLRAHLSRIATDVGGDLQPSGIEIRENSELARGELCLHTDLGTLDAKLKPQLERLAAALRDVLR